MAAKPLSVRAQINVLKKGESAPFPIERYDYVVSCRTRLQMTTGKKFSSKIEGAEVVITCDEDNAVHEVPAV